MGSTSSFYSRGRHLWLVPIILLFCAMKASAQSDRLFEAIRHNDLPLLKEMLSGDISLDIYDEDSSTVLMNASLYASVDCMELLLKKGAPVDAANSQGQTALMWSVCDSRKARLLLDHGANPNAKAASGNTPLLIASVGSNQFEIVKLLLDRGANPRVENNRHETPLDRVALFGDTATARLLLNHGLSVNDKSKKDKTPLVMALWNNNRPMVFWLLSNGADANVLDNALASALSYAVDLNDVEITKAVLDKTSDSVLNARDQDGMTPLIWATYDEHDNVAVVQALLDRGADIHIKDNKGRTALDWALRKGNTARVALLRKRAAVGSY